MILRVLLISSSLASACLTCSIGQQKSAEVSSGKSTVLIRADVDCKFSFDGKPLGEVRRGMTKLVDSAPGQHLIIGQGSEGKSWEQIVEIDVDKQSVVLAECYGPEEKRWKDLRWTAEDGDMNTQLYLALHYENDSPDFDESLYWYRKAAEHHDPIAETMIGALYERGKVRPQDYRMALLWYRKATDHGQAVRTAELSLVKIYHLGLGVPKNYAEALKWCDRVLNDPRPDLSSDFAGAKAQVDAYFDSTNADTADTAAVMLTEGGYGIEPDVQRSIKYFQRAADYREHLPAKPTDPATQK
jgi:TPR repeat protein